MGMTDVARCANFQATPDSWRVFCLQEIATLERGKFSARPRNDPRYFGGPYPFIQTGDVANSHGTVNSYSQTLNEDGLRVSRLFPANTLFFTIAANIGDVAVAPFATACPDSLIAISPKGQTDQSWLFYALGSRKRIFETLATQNAQLNINLEKLRPYELVVPPLPEQKAIAAALSDVDALLGALDRLIAKKRDLKQAAMQQLLTGQTRLPGFTGKWEERRVCDMGEVLAGKALDVYGAGHHRPYLRTKNVLDGRIDTDDVLEMPMTDAEFERFRVKRGDILLNEGQSLELVGRCSLYRDELPVRCAMQNQLLRFRRKATTSPSFAEQLFRCCQHDGTFASIATQTTSVAHLGSVRFANLRLRWPIDLEEQESIGVILADMDAELAALEQRRGKTHLLKQGMMQELLTGRTRLV